MRSIKTKLILGLSLLVIFLFSITAVLLISEKTKELSRDIYSKARSFSELTSPKIVQLAETLLKEKSFVLFNREIKDVFAKDEDVSVIRIASFAGGLVYDSETERDRGYEGAERKLEDADLRARVKSNLPSYLLASGRTVYLKKDADGKYAAVNENEKPVKEISDTDEIKNIVFTLDAKHAVIFDVTYENLRNRVVRMTERIVLLLIFGVLLGLGFGWYFSGRITNPIARLNESALILAQGDFTARVRITSKDEVGTLGETFNKMAADLEISTKAKIEHERLSKELEVAAKIQSQILPKQLPKIPGLDISAALIPAAEIGGDCYDFITVDPETNLIYLSDVTGHGVPSGIVVSIANALIYSYSNSPSLIEILASANRVLKEKTAQNMFMTLIMLRYHKGGFKYVSAGHPEMVHYSAAQKKVFLEKGGGIALGMIPDITKSLNEGTLEFEKGDSVILYSDGIPEAANPSGEMYGMARLRRALNESGELENAEAIKIALLADVKEFMAGAKQLDDITLVVLRRA